MPARSPAAASLETDGRPGLPSAPGRDRLSRWMGWRLRLLVGAVLLGCLGLFLLARWLGDTAAEWKVDLTQRLAAAGIELALRFHCNRDVTLTASTWP